ncbi:7256_t:CDS:2 [Diversispora eburnea]|uniref:7256_t:CDS:1 n=1 Tax=Diversispora eburnea TaxID=1213867 RepID=A0A9N8UX77_9GLOM|nr:7256_t:CDS:2 [Diversispora eburnea]
MGNTQSNSNMPARSIEDFSRSSETSQEDQIIPVDTGRTIESSFHDFGSNSPFVGSPLLSHEEYKKVEVIDDIYYGYSQNSSFNETGILTGSPRIPTSLVEPSYKNSNKIVHDFSSEISKKIPTIITWSQGGNNVYVTGTFNDWKYNIRLCKSSNDFTTVINLSPGTHKLKFIVDDEWKCSNDLSTATDPDGNLVNYLEVYEEEDETISQDGLNSDGLLSRTPPDEYTDEIPNFEFPDCMIEDQPPALPPHLERVLLNSSTISKEDNSVLPEPNHVVLNHLYACSIRDGVMAVAGTARYRKKYVTTVYYKPIFT